MILITNIDGKKFLINENKLIDCTAYLGKKSKTAIRVEVVQGAIDEYVCKETPDEIYLLVQAAKSNSAAESPLQIEYRLLEQISSIVWTLSGKDEIRAIKDYLNNRTLVLQQKL